MVIFLYGEDSYRSKQKLDEMVAHYKEVRKSGLNLMHVDASKISFADFYNNFKISSMFDEKKLVIVKNVFSNKKFQEDFVKHAEEVESLKDIVVVYESEACDARLKIFKFLVKECKSQDFALLDAKNTKAWAQKELAALGASINMDALDVLASSVGPDLWRLSGEVKKLADYKKGAVIRKEDVELLVKPKIEMDIFKTIDALAQKNKKQALNLVHKHLDAGDNPLYLLSMIAFQFKNLLVIKELAEKGLMYASIVKKSGLHPFVVKKNYYACNQFSFAKLKEIYQTIYQVDLDIKTGKVEPETALDLLVASI